MTGELVLTSIEDSVNQIMDNITNILNEANMTLSNVVKCSIFMKDMNDYAAINEVYGRYFKEVPPAREAVQVARLPKDVTVEISCIAVK
jgi:2-iminobutanoate/2-iminopropanoate deaminase